MTAIMATATATATTCAVSLSNQAAPMMKNNEHLPLKIGQQVEVASRTWAGINKPGGVGNITKVHYSDGYIDCFDVKYLVAVGTDTRIDAEFVKAHAFLESRGRARRTNQVMNVQPHFPKKVEHKKRSRLPLVEQSKSKTNSATTTKSSTAKSDKVTDPHSSQKKRKNQHLDTNRAKANTSPDQLENECPSDERETNNLPKGLPSTIGFSKARPPDISPIPTDSSRKVKRKSKSKTPASLPHRVTPCESVAIKHDSSLFKETNKLLLKHSSKTSNKMLTSTNTLKKDPLRKKKTSAVVATISTANRVALPDVYQKGLQSATVFVSDLIATKTTKKHVVVDSRKKPVVPQEEPVMNSSRRQQFMSLFGELLRKKDGVIDADKILVELNRMEKSQTPFTTKEVDCGIQQLCSQDKVMLSDGQVYSISW